MQNSYPIKTGLEKLDEITGGFFPGEITFIGSIPSGGKTTFLVSLIKRMIYESGTSVLLYTTGKPKENIYDNLISLLSGISYTKVRNSRLHFNQNHWLPDKNETLIVEKLTKQVWDLPLIINDTEELNINQLCEEARKLCNEEDVKVIFVDNLYLLCNEQENQSLEEAYFEIIEKIKKLAQELNVPIVITGHISCMARHETPNLQHIYHIREIDKFSDVMILLNSARIKEEYESYPVKAIVAKNTHGDTGTINCLYYPRIQSIVFSE